MASVKINQETQDESITFPKNLWYLMTVKKKACKVSCYEKKKHKGKDYMKMIFLHANTIVEYFILYC